MLSSFHMFAFQMRRLNPAFVGFSYQIIFQIIYWKECGLDSRRKKNMLGSVGWLELMLKNHWIILFINFHTNLKYLWFTSRLLIVRNANSRNINISTDLYINKAHRVSNNLNGTIYLNDFGNIHSKTQIWLIFERTV